MKTVNLSMDELKIIKSIFANTEHQILLFGSRVKGTNTKFSDLDVCVKGLTQIPLSEFITAKNACSNSDLPFKVDIVDYHSISKGFKEIIDREAVLLDKVVPTQP